MSFLSPALAWFGLAAASIPIIIHLLNRRRFQRIDWAPMKYLKLTIKKNRRRLQIEQLLLLLLRVLAMLVLFLTVARPMLSGSGFRGWLGGQQRKSRVVVIDDSPSMAETQADGNSLFDRAKKAAIEIVRSANSDQLTLFTTSQPESPLVRQSQLDDSADLAAEIIKLKPSAMMNGWSATLGAVEEFFLGSAYPMREAVLITDARAAGWNDGVARSLEKWKQENKSLTIIDVGQPPISNLAIRDLRQVSPVALAGAKLELEAEVANYSSQPVSGLQATLFVDGQPQSIELPSLDTDSKTIVPLRLEIPDPGQHRIRLELPPDQATADNVRFLVVDVRAEISIVMVDGDPKTASYASETYFLAAAARSGRSPWRVTVVTELSDVISNQKRPDILVLANLGSVSTDQASRLRKMVSNGMGLIVFPGDLVDPSNYNSVLFSDGNGLIPARISETRESEISGLSIEPVSDSPLSVLSQLAPEVLNRVQPKQHLQVHVDETATNVRVLAKWNDPERNPALIEKRVGQGRVYLWTVTADRGWSDWPQEISFVVANRQVMLYAATQAMDLRNVLAGQPIQASFSATEMPVSPTIERPHLDNKVPLPVDTSGLTPKLAYQGTRHAGFYDMSWDGADDVDCRAEFAVNADPRESEPQRMTRAAFQETLGDIDWRLVPFGSAETSSENRSELWRRGAMLLLGLFGMESFVAAWIGRER